MKNIFILQGLDLLSIEQIQKEQFHKNKINPQFANIIQKRDGKNLSSKEVIDLCNFPILGSDQFVVIIENYSKCFKKKEQITEILTKCPRDCLLFLIEIFDPNKKKELSRLIKENKKNFGNSQNIEIFSADRGNPFIKKYLKQKISDEGLTINEDALNYLLENFKDNYSFLYGEINKIISYCFHEKEITLEAVRELTVCQEKDIFQIINAILHKNKNFYIQNINRFVQKENLIGLVYFLQGDIKRKITSYNNTNYSQEQLTEKLLMLFHIEKIIFSENIVNPSKDSSSVNLKALNYLHRFVFSF